MFTIQKEANLIFNTIYHISDIHVRPLDRHEEYQQIFTKVYDLLKADTNERRVVVITGDLLHDKTKIEPEMLILVYDFILQLTKLCKGVIMIIGNHDLRESNLNRMDNITPIVRNIPNVYFLKNTGVYDFQSCLFCVVNSLADRQVCLYKDISFDGQNNKTIVALYHGMIEGVSDFPSKYNRHKNLEEFKGFDMVLLGDIHKHQFIKPNIAYPGSLIQQNFGEERDNHGLIIWNIETQNPQFISIENDYGFVKIYVDHGKQQNTEIEIPQYPRLKYYHKNTTSAELQAIRERVEKTKIVQYVQDIDNGKDITIPKDMATKTAEVIDDIKMLNECLKECNNTELTFLMEYHAKLKKDKLVDKALNMQKFIIGTLTFKNTYAYSNNQTFVLDFSDKDGVIAISGNNATGKTNILKLLLFSLYGKISTNSSVVSILNNDSRNYSVALEFTNGIEKYKIEKHGSEHAQKKLDNKITLMQYDNTIHRWLDIDHVNNKITDILGIEKDEFMYINIYSNTFYKSILNETPAEQITILNKCFGLDWYTILEENASADIKELTTKTTGNKTKLDTLLQIQKTYQPITTLTATLLELEHVLENISAQSKTVTNQIEVETKSIEEFDQKEKELLKLIDTRFCANYKANNLVEEKDIKQIETKLNGYKTALTTNSIRLAQITTQIQETNKAIKTCECKERDLSHSIDPRFNTPVADTLEQMPTVANINKSYEYYVTKLESIEIQNIAEYRNSKQALENKMIEFKIPIQEYEKKLKGYIKTIKETSQEEANKTKERLALIKILQTGRITTNRKNRMIAYLETQESSVYKEYVSTLLQKQEHLDTITKLNQVNKQIEQWKEAEELQTIIKILQKQGYEKNAAIQAQRDDIAAQLVKTQVIQKSLEEEKLNLIKTIENTKSNIIQTEQEIIDNTKTAEIDQKSIAQNAEIYKQIETLKPIQNKSRANKTELEQKAKEIIRKHENISNNIQQTRDTIVKVQETDSKIARIQAEMAEDENKIKLYKLYHKCVGKKGIPLQLLTNKVKDMTDYINTTFLEPFTGFTIIIKIENHTVKKKDMDKAQIARLEFEIITKNGKKLDTIDGSGYERFILNIALKSAMYKYSNIGKISLFAVDEGLDCVDKVNFPKLQRLFQVLKSQFRHVLLMTHIDKMNDFCDYAINIEKDENQYSTVGSFEAI